MSLSPTQIAAREAAARRFTAGLDPRDLRRSILALQVFSTTLDHDATNEGAAAKVARALAADDALWADVAQGGGLIYMQSLGRS